MSPGAIFERVYRSLKAEIGSGRHPAGAALEPAALAAGLMSSITPVRDALHRLVGERLVEAPHGDGFRTPLVTELALRNLYRWNASLAALALRAGRGAARIACAGGEAAEGLGPVETLFAAIASRNPNPEHLAAVLRLNARLRPARRVEAGLLPDSLVELLGLRSALEAGELRALRSGIAAYHRRRERLAPEIVAALRGRC